MNTKKNTPYGEDLRQIESIVVPILCVECDSVPKLVHGVLYCPNSKKIDLDIPPGIYQGLDEYNIVSRHLPCNDLPRKIK